MNAIRLANSNPHVPHGAALEPLRREQTSIEREGTVEKNHSHEAGMILLGKPSFPPATSERLN